jgi:hypothetical protein
MWNIFRKPTIDLRGISISKDFGKAIASGPCGLSYGICREWSSPIN